MTGLFLLLPSRGHGLAWIETTVLVTAEQVTTGASQLVGLAVLAGTLAALVALLYRWLTREQIPVGLALLVGLAAVAVYLNTTTVLGRIIGGEPQALDAALFNIVAFLFGTVGSVAGHHVGDRFGADVLLERSDDDVDDDVSRLVRTVGRVTVVELPDDVDDVVGYDPVSPATREKLSGKRFVFPRNLTVEELRDRLVSRLKTDYGVGTVDVELSPDGAVEYLAVGSHTAGIGPTLPPGTNAVAIRADPAFSASTGDLVQVWETDPLRRVLTAELRGVAEDVVTIAISSADTPKIDPTRTYRLVTLPVDDRPEREFASVLRAADETFSSVTVEAGSPLHGMPVDALDLTVVGVRPENGEPIPVPRGEYVLEPGDLVFAISVPDALRRLETASEPLDSWLQTGTATKREETSDDSTVERQETDRASKRGTARTSEIHEDGDDGPGDHGSAENAVESTDTVASDSATADTSDAPSFDEEATFDADDTLSPESESVDETGNDTDGSDDLVGLDEAEIDFGDDTDPMEDDLPGDDPFEAIDAAPEEGDEGDEKTDEESEKEEADGGGGSTFQQLKEEFESGEADWEEDVSDSPGGDMRLDE